MSEKKTWIGVIAGGCLLGAGAGALIWFQYQSIAEARTEVAQLRANIGTARELLKGTTELEREVIVLRETEEAIKEILPGEQDVNNFVRTLRRFEEDSEIRITGLKKKPLEVAGREKKEFDKVAYQLTFETDAFQLLSFLNELERDPKTVHEVQNPRSKKWGKLAKTDDKGEPTGEFWRVGELWDMIIDHAHASGEPVRPCTCYTIRATRRVRRSCRKC